MASVRIEDKGRTDPRLKILGKLLGTSRFDALGRMVQIWSQCTEQKTYYLSKALIDTLAEHDGFADLIMHPDVDLAVETARGIRIKGTKGRIEWYSDLKKGQSNGGKARSRKAQRNPDGTFQHPIQLTSSTPSSSEPAQSSSLSLSLSPVPVPVPDSISLSLSLDPVPVPDPCATQQKTAPRERERLDTLKAMTSECVKVWGETLRGFKIAKDPRFDELAIGELIQRHGLEKTALALLGAGQEKKNESTGYDPAQNVSILRLKEPKNFDRFVNLGAKAKFKQQQAAPDTKPAPTENLPDDYVPPPAEVRQAFRAIGSFSQLPAPEAGA